MKAAALKLKNYAAGSVNIVNNSDLNRRLSRFLLGSLGLLALVYVFLLASMVYNIVGRRSLEAEARTLSSDVGDMELTYLSLSNKIDLPLSYSLGFKEADAEFAARQSLDPIKSAASQGSVGQAPAAGSFGKVKAPKHDL